MGRARDLYRDSWRLYKTHTESFSDDLDFYAQFCGKRRSLELFAGYGRVANPLAARGVDLETVELSPNFARHIELPKRRNHVCSVLDFTPARPFARVFAAYNSFCLLTDPADLRAFFTKLRSWLEPKGRACLSYYSVSHWKDAVPGEFSYRGKRVRYIPKWDLSERRAGLGTWIDEYRLGRRVLRHAYRVRLHEDRRALAKELAAGGLRLTGVVRDFGLKEPSEPGWVDFLIERAS